MADDVTYEQGERPIETSSDVFVGLSPEAKKDLLAAGRLSARIRKLRAQVRADVLERQRIMARACDRVDAPDHKNVKYPAVSRAVGLSVSVVTREVKYGRAQNGNGQG